ncbi:endonuclease/exonuclease/phosphatase family protein, partial [Chloroflexota bacterium]
SNPSTSNGIFVYLGERTNIVSTADFIEVSGTVSEYYGLTEISADPANVKLLSKANPLPPAVELNPPFGNALSRAYLETLEGMLVQLPTARVVGPTDSRSETWVIRDDLGLERVFQDDPLGTGEVVCVGEDGHYKIDPPARVGDHIQNITGVLGFSLGTYRIALLEQPSLIPGNIPSLDTVDDSEPEFTFASFNFNNLFDTVDDPAKDDPVLGNTEYHRKLDKLALTLHHELGEPTILAVQEVENDTVLKHLLAREVIKSDYGIAWIDSPDNRGIDNALIYRLDKVTLLGFEGRQGCTSLVDGFGPDGNRDVHNPQNSITCDISGDGVLDGNRLFSRPPLVVQLQVTLEDGEPLPLWVITNHWKSKREDTYYQAYTLPRRLEQAKFVAALTDEILMAKPWTNLIVLGDLNDFPNSQTLGRLTQTWLRDLTANIPRPSRYTYIYQGISQVLDYALVSPALSMYQLIPESIHLNADFPSIYQDEETTTYRSSDHDPVIVKFALWAHKVYLPMIR